MELFVAMLLEKGVLFFLTEFCIGDAEFFLKVVFSVDDVLKLIFKFFIFLFHAFYE